MKSTCSVVTVLRCRLARAALITACTVGLAITAGCTADDTSGVPHSPNDIARKTPAAEHGVVSEAQAKEILDHYVRINNAANKVQSAKRLGMVESGQLYRLSTSDYQRFPAWSKQDQDRYSAPFYLVDPQFYIPSNTGWFAGSARLKDDSDQERMFFIFEQDGRQWKMTMAAWMMNTKKLSEIATKPGNVAITADPGKKIGALAPNNVPDAVGDLYVTGGKNAGRFLADSGASRAARETYRDRNDKWDGKAKTTFAKLPPKDKTVYALETSGGGVVAIVPFAHLQSTTATQPGVVLTPSPEQAVFDSSPRTVVKTEYQGIAIAHLSTSGKAKVLEIRYRATDSR